MAITTDIRSPFYTSAIEAVPATIDAIQSLGVDEQLHLLWIIYENLGGAITPAAPGAARLQLAQGLLDQIKAMSYDEQLEAMRDLVNKKATPVTRAYGILSNNNKLAFWYQLAEWMRTGEVVPVPENYRTTPAVSSVYNKIALLNFNQQITVLRQAVVNMGVDALA
jgi:hypothetical protein